MGVRLMYFRVPRPLGTTLIESRMPIRWNGQGVFSDRFTQL